MTTDDHGTRPVGEPDTGREPPRRGDAERRSGSVGPHDPHADPATDPGLRRPDRDDPPTQPVTTDPGAGPPATGSALAHSRAGGLWVGLILSAIVLVFLLVFIVQNGDPVQINFLAWSGSLPTGVALLLAAVAGLLLVAIPGVARILQLRRAVKRTATRR